MSGTLSRRELISGAGIGAAALLLDPRGFEGQTASSRTVVFSHTTTVNVDRVQDDVAIASTGNDCGDRSHRRPPEEVSQRRRLRRRGEGALPRPHHLPRAHGGGAGARFQRIRLMRGRGASTASRPRNSTGSNTTSVVPSRHGCRSCSRDRQPRVSTTRICDCSSRRGSRDKRRCPATAAHAAPGRWPCPPLSAPRGSRPSRRRPSTPGT